MGTYTTYDLPHVDATVATHLELLAELCAATCGPTLRSLILGGSFGRGEGSVLLGPGDTVTPLRDYDVRLIVDQRLPQAVLAAIKAAFATRTGFNADERFSGEHGFALTLEQLSWRQLHEGFVRDRDLRAYDFLAASRVICGEDPRPALRFPASAIPKVNGMRLLYKKMIGLVGHRAGVIISDGVRGTLGYECDKALIEVCTALVLLAGRYEASYAARAELFAREWRAWYPELAAELPWLAEQVARATTEKLRPGSTPPIAPAEAFAVARAALLVAHRCCARRLYGLDVAPGPAGVTQMRRALTADLFRAAVEAWLRQRGLGGCPARAGLSLAYHRERRLAYARAAGEQGAAALWHALRAAETPQIDIFLSAWCALAALDGEPDAALLACAAASLRRLPARPQAVVAGQGGWALYRQIRTWQTEAFATWQSSL